MDTANNWREKMSKKKITELERGEYLDCGQLDDGSHICIRRGDRSMHGPYEIVKEIPGQSRRANPVLEKGFLTLQAAKEYAWKIWGNITGTDVKIKKGGDK